MRRVLDGFVDAWDALNADTLAEDGLTFDSTKNTICCINAQEPVRLRIDRVMARGVVPAAIEVRGRQSIGAFFEHQLFVSDHFGVLAHFS